jgi:hypothetical protein
VRPIHPGERVPAGDIDAVDVRPDGYLGSVAGGADEDALRGYLEMVLIARGS